MSLTSHTGGFVINSSEKTINGESWTSPLDTKPQYNRKRRKDGSVRKARIFGKPWWYEKAGWYEEKCNERRNAILERLKQRWPDLHVLKSDSFSDKDIEDEIRPLVASFDDSSWCLPKTSDLQRRLNEQLAIYTAWSRFIIRETARSHTPNRGTASESLPFTPSVPRPPMNALPGQNESLTRHWGQTREVGGSLNKRGVQLSDQSELGIPADKRKSDASGDEIKTEHNDSVVQPQTSTVRSRSVVTSSMVDTDNGANVDDGISDDETETTEISDSEPAQETIDDFDTTAANPPTLMESQSNPVWDDTDWDDVVVRIDARKLDGEYYPIPMTMLKPASNRDACRWDDFELDHLYSRFEVESGQSIDRMKYSIVYTDKGTSLAINTPGKYKLMLKEFSRKTQRSSAMVLHLRIATRRSPNLRSSKDRQKSTSKYTQTGTAKSMQRSQFTGAASDFSTDSDSETAMPTTKRRRSDGLQIAKTPSRTKSAIGTGATPIHDQIEDRS